MSPTEVDTDARIVVENTDDLRATLTNMLMLMKAGDMLEDTGMIGSGIQVVVGGTLGTGEGVDVAETRGISRMIRAEALTNVAGAAE